MASLLAPPCHGSSRSRSGYMSRLSSTGTAVCAEYLYAEDLQGLSICDIDSQEAKRRIGRSGKVYHEVGLLDYSDDEPCSELSPQLMQLQGPLQSGVRRVTFSTGGGPEPMQQQQQQPFQSEQPAPLLAHAARLWRGAAASVCAGHRLQSLEAHAAQLKQRQEIHTELKAWVNEALARPQDELLQPCLEDSDLQLGHASAHAQQQQQQQQSAGCEGACSQDGGAGPVGEHQRRRKSSHRPHRRHRRHHAAAPEDAQAPPAAPQQEVGGDTAAAPQESAVSAPVEGAATGQQGPGQEAQLLVSHQVGDLWHQFNAAEQQLIAHLQQDQQALMDQLQQAYQQIAALTAAPQAAAVVAAAAAAGPDNGQHQQGDLVLHPAPETQVLVINTASSSQQDIIPHATSPEQGMAQQSEQRRCSGLEPDAAAAAAAAAAQPTAAAARRSSISSPRSKLSSKAVAGSQHAVTDIRAGSPRTPRTCFKPGPKAPAAAAADVSAPSSPRKSLQAAAAARGTARASLPVPQGRGLTLSQQQALVQRLQQAEEVMDLLQQDLTDALQAQQQMQQQLQQQMHQVQAAGCAEGQGLGQEQQQQQQQQQQQAQAEGSGGGVAEHGSKVVSTVEQQAGQLAPGGGLRVQSEQVGPRQSQGEAVAAAERTVLQQQLQEQVQVSTASQQELAEARSTSAAQQQQMAHLQQELQQHEDQAQQQAQQITALREELVAVTESLQSLQCQHQALLAAQEPAHAVPPQQQQQLRAAAVAAGGPVCCQHEERCQQLQTVLQALMQQMQQGQQQYSASCMRAYTAAAQGSPRVRASRQHRHVQLHTWLYPPLEVPRPTTPRPAQLQPQGTRFVSATRCATASSPRTAQWERGRRCNTNVPLTARCAGIGGAGALQDGGTALQSSDFRLRPLTYRGPDRAGTDTMLSATDGKRQLSVDAEKGLLSSLVVAPVSARGLSTVDVVAGQSAAAGNVAGAVEGCASLWGGRGGNVHAVHQGAARRGIPKLALGGLH